MIVGEVWVALRPQMTSFGSDIKKELEKIINPSGATGIGGLMNKVGALSLAGFITAAAVSAKFAIDLQKSQATLQGTMDITAQKASGIGKALLATAGTSTYSGIEMMRALAPVGGQLRLINGGALTVAQSLDVMRASAQLADATNQDLSGNTAALVQVLQAFTLRTHDSSAAANALYTTSTATGVGVTQLATTVSQLHMRLGDLAGTGIGSLTNVGSLMADLAGHGTVGSRGIRAVASGLEHLIVQAAKSGPAIEKTVSSAAAKVTAAEDALAKAKTRLSQKQAEVAFAGGPSSPSQVFALANAQAAVAAAQEKLTLSQENLSKAQKGGALLSSSAAAEMNNLGLRLYDANGKFVGIRQLLIELVPKFEHLKGQARELALSNLFGAGAAQQFNRIIEAGVGGFDKASAAVTRHNAVANAAAAYQKTLAGQMQELRATLSDLATQFGSLLLPALQDIAKVVAGVTRFFIQNKVAAEILGAVIATVLGAAILHYVGSVSVKFVQALQGDLQGLLGLAKGATGAGEKVAGASVKWNEAAQRWQTSTGKFVSAAKAAEIQAAEQAGAAEKGAAAEASASDSVVVSLGKQIAAYARAGFAAVVGAAKAAGAWAAGAAETAAIWALQAGEAIASAASTAAAWAASAAETVAIWAVMAAEAVTDAAVQVGAWAAVAAAAVAAFIAENIATLGIASAIALLVAALVWMGLHWKQVWGFVKSIALDVWHFLDNDVIHPIERAFHWLIGEIKAHWDLLLPIFLGPVGAVLLIWKHFHTSIVNGILSVVHWFEALPGRILAAVAGFATLLVNAGIDLMKGLGHGIVHGLDGVRHTIAHVTDNVVGWVTSGFGIFSPSRKFAEIGGHLMEGLGKGISDTAHVARSALSALGLKVPKFEAATFESSLRTATSAFAKFVHGADSGTSKLMTCFGDLASTATRTLGGLGSSLLHAGVSLAGGLASGIGHGVSAVTGAIGGMASSVIGSVSSVFGIFSPSRKFADIGGFLMQGLAKGISDQQHLPQKVLDGLGLNVPGVRTGPTGTASSSNTVQHEILVAMRQLVTAERQNTAALKTLTAEEMKPRRVAVTGVSGHHRRARGGTNVERELARALSTLSPAY